MSTPITIYPNPPIVAGFPTAADPPLAGPMPADLDDYYTAQTIREGGFLTAPRSSYSSTPITGTAASTIGLVITLHYGTSLYEVVYQLGAFTPLYVAGSTVNLGTGAYSLVRAGGFPPGVTVDALGCTPCPPCPPIPTAGQTWASIYAVDFTTLPTQTMQAAGSYTIDGKTWWAKGAMKNTGSTLGLVNGTGLRSVLQGPFTPFLSWRSDGNVTWQDRVMVMSLGQLADYNPNAPLAVAWRATGQADGGSNGEAGLYMGLCDAALSTANLLGTEKATAFTIGYLGDGSSNYVQSTPHNNTATSQWLAQLTAPPVSPINTLDTLQLGVCRFSAQRFYPLVAHYAGSLGTPDTMVEFNITAANAPARAGGGQSNTPCILIAPQLNSNGPRTWALTHLRVMQPKVP